MRHYLRRNHWFAVAAIVGAFVMPLGAAQAQGAAEAATPVEAERPYDIPAGSLADALHTFSEQSGVQVFFETDMVSGKTAPSLNETLDARAALSRLLAGSGLQYEYVNDNTLILKQPGASGPRPGIEEIIVTGQKREERIQDVPIAISAFSAEDLEAQKIEGGFDLLKAIPNVTFTKTNFSGYNFQIRGIGTQAISATTDPAVAVSFNNTTLITNRLFEQEYLDVERVEVLRGPQGTLYGRNATAGVVNVISNKPELGVWDGMIDVEVGNYNTRRLRGMFNMPLGDTFAIRGAYASTKRDGYGHNNFDDSDVDGRDLWSSRLSLGWQPTDTLRVDLIWERFEEDDNRQRTSKQLCHRDPGFAQVGDVDIVEHINALTTLERSMSIFSQGCQPGSLYSDAAFQKPNGLRIPFVAGLSNAAAGIGLVDIGLTVIPVGADPYAGTRQSRDLRDIFSQLESRYTAQADIVQLNVDFELTPALTLASQTAYNSDEYFATQDFNRFTTQPNLFADGAEIRDSAQDAPIKPLLEDGIFCDPQLGCSDSIVGQDVSQTDSEQFSQEFRLQSDFAGPLNFSVGANYVEYETVADYFVFFNGITLASIVSINTAPFYGSAGEDRYTFDPDCTRTSPTQGFQLDMACVPIDERSISEITGDDELDAAGHNFFLSRNPYELESKAVFGELYWNIRDDLKLTLGLRYTDDEKVFEVIPSQTVLTPQSYPGIDALVEEFGSVTGFTRDDVIGLPLFGTGFGYPSEPDETRRWRETTGRVVLDWQPVLDFTDETLIYGSFSRGYKGGGLNPPRVGLNYEAAETSGRFYPPTAPPDFEPEFVNAYEVGTKNTLFGGAVLFNATAFYYDYSDYQVSRIVERTAVNENFDAEVWGLEFESVFAPSPNWQFLANIGYLDTKIAEGEESIDTMDRLAGGHEDWVVVQPALTLMSNCVIPVEVAEIIIEGDGPYFDPISSACPGGSLLGADRAGNDSFFSGTLPDGSTYDPAEHPEANFGAGFKTDLSGNELPNSPHFTVSLGGQYSFDLTRDWRATARMDYYWQDESYHRVYNLEPYDRLKSWSNTNLSFWVNNPNSGITVEAYVKNLFDETPITGAFLNSDDAALTTNVFTLDPRLIGVSVRKEFF